MKRLVIVFIIVIVSVSYGICVVDIVQVGVMQRNAIISEAFRKQGDRTMKTHMRSIRLRNNAGMDYPLCKEHGLIDGKYYITTGDKNLVTCKNCITRMKNVKR